MIGIGVILRSEPYIHVAIGEQQARPLQLAERLPTESINDDWAAWPLRAGGDTQSMQPENNVAVLQRLSHHVEGPGGDINHRCAGNPDFWPDRAEHQGLRGGSRS